MFEAAREMKKYVIGVDMDQWKEAPGFVLTSMVKKGNAAVYEIIKEWKANKFDGGKARFLVLPMTVLISFTIRTTKP